jgi:hypothetical protein
MSNGQEKRKYKRRGKPYMARLQVKQYEGLEISSAEWDLVALENLSAEGTFFSYKKDLGIGTLLDLKIDVSKSTPTVKCVGKVIRIDKPKSTSMYGVAIKLINIGEQEKEVINTTVEKALE